MNVTPNAKRLPAIKSYLNIDKIKADLDRRSISLRRMKYNYTVERIRAKSRSDHSLVS